MEIKQRLALAVASAAGVTASVYDVCSVFRSLLDNSTRTNKDKSPANRNLPAKRPLTIIFEARERED